MFHWKLSTATLPKGSMRVKYLPDVELAEGRIDYSGETILWKGRPHWTIFRLGLIICNAFGCVIVWFVTTRGLPFSDVWPFVAFGGFFIVKALLSALSLSKTEYVITTKRILEIQHFWRTVEAVDVASYRCSHPGMFGFLGKFPQLFRLYDVKYTMLPDGSLGKSTTEWRYFFSVTASDMAEIKRAFDYIKSSPETAL